MSINIKAHVAREADILIQAANERRELNKMKLPGEPDLKKNSSRLDNDGLQNSIGNLLGRYGQKIEEQQAAAAAEEEKKGEGWKREIAATSGKRTHDYRA